MLGFGRKSVKSAANAPEFRFVPATPPGRLIYAIGDLHGRADLLRRMMEIIEEDRARQTVDPTPALIFLGDYVDRGGESRQVLSDVVKLQADSSFEVIALRGNHDQFVLDFLERPQLGRSWINYGGADTLRAFGVRPPAITDEDGWVRAADELAAAMPSEHLAFLKNTRHFATFGDYIFVHAGIRPNVALEAQDPSDLISIRAAFLSSEYAAPGRVVVFGHTPFEQPLVNHDKIGIDTGACVTGVLTALALGAGSRRFLQTVESNPIRPVPTPTDQKDGAPQRL